jgi:hypothetical protein
VGPEGPIETELRPGWRLNWGCTPRASEQNGKCHLDKDGECLQKIHSEGYGEFPQPFSEVHLHWRVTGADGVLVHSSRYTVQISPEGGMKHVEDEDKVSEIP